MCRTLDTVALDRHGWTVVPGVLAPEQATALGQRCLALLENELDRRMNDKPAGGTTRATELFDRMPDLRSMLDRPSLRAAAEHLLGRPPVLNDATFRCALPGFGEQRLHADGLTVEPGSCDGVTAVVALCEFTPLNGSTAVVSGSHRWPAHLRHAGGHVGRLEERFLGPAGTVFVFSSQVLHRGTRNDTGTPRPALQLFWK